MIKHYQYRFKTKEEFRKKYGADWRYNNTYYNFIECMDHLLGKDYPFDVKPGDELPFLEGWGMAWNFLIENKPLEPNYKPKKIERSL